MTRYAEILTSHNGDVECTASPFWAIVAETASGLVLLEGVWFNRTTAETVFQRQRYRYPKKAFVYAYSGRESHVSELYALAYAERALEPAAAGGVKEP